MRHTSKIDNHSQSRNTYTSSSRPDREKYENEAQGGDRDDNEILHLYVVFFCFQILYCISLQYVVIINVSFFQIELL